VLVEAHVVERELETARDVARFARGGDLHLDHPAGDVGQDRVALLVEGEHSLEARLSHHVCQGRPHHHNFSPSSIAFLGSIVTTCATWPSSFPGTAMLISPPSHSLQRRLFNLVS